MSRYCNQLLVKTGGMGVRIARVLAKAAFERGRNGAIFS